MLVTNPKFQPPSCDLPSVVHKTGDDIHIILPLVGLAEPFKVISQAAHFILRMRKLRGTEDIFPKTQSHNPYVTATCDQTMEKPIWIKLNTHNDK